MPENLMGIQKIKSFLNRKLLPQYNTETCKDILDEIKSLKFEELSDERLREISEELIDNAVKGINTENFLARGFALVREASRRVLGLYPYDVQIVAGIAMYHGNIVEMQTGEGKTLAAVFAAYLKAVEKKGVHILTFNDYLAKRDAQWMGPVYEFLGLTVGYIQEDMELSERKRSYECDITYATAKEAGFDYLRGFLAIRAEELIQRKFNFAIIDEADSILIDEARIPLVIAGDIHGFRIDAQKVWSLVRDMKQYIHYDTDEYAYNVCLTEEGIEYIEKVLGCGNLYGDKNLELLADINNALHAKTLLKRDVDYIVREGRIELVDEFTGRVAENRKWPDGLQAAIEAKEGILAKDNGQILYSITLQNFIRQYPGFCGMTGTAQTSAEEFREFYGIDVVVISTNRLCIRVDYPDLIFTDKGAKYKALIKEIVEVHKKGQPVLIGTCSVEESEFIYMKLKEAGVECQVLNAKNDEMEARIIEMAGKIGSVTVSTNMAGRGTDIKLGGGEAGEHKRVSDLGGLYVIGTNRHESMRIDNQLRGRAGRQGDPGTTRFFISLEDDLLKRYGIRKLIPEKFYPEKSDAPIENKIIKLKVAGAQRIVQGQNFDIRKTLCKYSDIIEQQRRIIYRRRQALLMNVSKPGLFKAKLSYRYMQLCQVASEEILEEAERKVMLYHINKCWAEYLSYISYIRESAHLYNIGGKVPLDEFNKAAIEAFDNLLKVIEERVIDTLNSIEIGENGIDMEKEGLRSPSSTWTYIVDDGIGQFGFTPALGNVVAPAINPMLYITLAIYKAFKDRAKR